MGSIFEKQLDLDLIPQLKDGILLCKIANAIKPKVIKGIYNDHPFGHLENITRFINFCRDDLKIATLFSVSDILYNVDPPRVIDCLHAVATAGSFFNTEIPKIRQKLPGSKYSSHQINIAVEYVIQRMRFTSALQ